MTTDQLSGGLVGFALGLAAGGCYLLMLRHSVRRLVQAKTATSLLVSAPLRLAVPVVVLVLAAQWDRSALLGAALGLVLMQLGGRWFVRNPAGHEGHGAMKP